MDKPEKNVSSSSARVASSCIFNCIIASALLAGICSLVIIRLTSGNSIKENKTSPTGLSTTIRTQAAIFRDDFNGQLNQAWTWQNEDTSRYKVHEDGWLEIIGGNESILAGERQTNLLWIALPEGNIEISIHLKSQPLFDFQRAGLLLYQDSNHYIVLSHGYCMQCVLGGSGIYLEYSLNGKHEKVTTASLANELYLMLIVEDGAVNAFYALEEAQWQHIASVKNDIRFERAALSVTNDTASNTGYDLIGMFDYFEIRSPTQIAPTPTPGLFQQASSKTEKFKPYKKRAPRLKVVES